MESLVSIEVVEKKYNTSGSRPLLVHASDLAYYVTKYPYYRKDPKLLNEFLAYHFAKVWGLYIPEMKLIRIKREHLPNNFLGMQLSYVSIENTLIGSQHLDGVTEVFDKLSEGYSNKDLNRFDKTLLLKIALFDIWLSNEDRNTGNMNLLVSFESDILSPVIIDNEKIFNSGSPFGQLTELTYEDSLFYTILFARLFGKRNKENLELFSEIQASLQSFCSLCFSQLHQIIENVPNEWGVNKDELHNSLVKNLFSNAWIYTVKKTFLQHASRMTQKL